MRTLILALVFSLTSLLSAADAKAGFVNQKVSARSVPLNQAVRVEFTTLPRQIEGVDIQATVRHALELSSVRPTWRVLGKPTVSEHEKTKTVTVVISLLPRHTGDCEVPQIPLSWLTGNQTADFGKVTVAPAIQIGAESRDLPKEVEAVSGYKWGLSFTETQSQFAPEKIKRSADATVIRAADGLDLIFRGGELAEAIISAPGLGLAEARDSFINRWGIPQFESDEPAELTWILGWTVITARPLATSDAAPQGGTELHLLREDITGRIHQNQVQAKVFGLLEGKEAAAPPAPKTQAPSQDEAIDRDIGKPAITPPPDN